MCQYVKECSRMLPNAPKVSQMRMDTREYYNKIPKMPPKMPPKMLQNVPNDPNCPQNAIKSPKCLKML
jgi:hypothetical protein